MKTPPKTSAIPNTVARAAGFVNADADFIKWVTEQNLITISDKRNRQCGFLLHGPVKPGEAVIINRIHIDPPHQRQGHGRAAVQQLIDRANVVGCTSINVRCPADQPANWFFLALGFQIIRSRSTAGRPEPGFRLYTYPLLDDHQPTRTPHKFQNPGVSEVL